MPSFTRYRPLISACKTAVIGRLHNLFENTNNEVERPKRIFYVLDDYGSTLICLLLWKYVKFSIAINFAWNFTRGIGPIMERVERTWCEKLTVCMMKTFCSYYLTWFLTTVCSRLLWALYVGRDGSLRYTDERQKQLCVRLTDATVPVEILGARGWDVR